MLRTASSFSEAHFIKCATVVFVAASSTPLARKRSAEKKAVKSRVRDEARALYRKAILDAAEAVFAEKGMHVARVQDIAARAGLSVGVIYNYFEQKEDVLIALLTERIDGLVAEFAVRDDDPREFTEQLVTRVTRFFTYTDIHRAFFQVASEHGLLGPGSTSAQTLLAGKTLTHAAAFERAVLQLVDEGVAKGVLKPLDRDFLALHLRHTLKSASLWRRAHSEVSVADTARLAVDSFLGGVAR
jgi:AcrR family transcriptional regulator